MQLHNLYNLHIDTEIVCIGYVGYLGALVPAPGSPSAAQSENGTKAEFFAHGYGMAMA